MRDIVAAHLENTAGYGDHAHLEYWANGADFPWYRREGKDSREEREKKTENLGGPVARQGQKLIPWIRTSWMVHQGCCPDPALLAPTQGWGSRAPP